VNRLLVPLALLAVAAAAWFGSDYLGNPDVRTPILEELTSSDTPMLSARRMPELLVSPIAERALSSELEQVAVGGACLVVTDGPDVIYDHQSSVSFTPASVQKLLTGFAALEQFGPNHRFVTRLMALSQPENGTLQGNLYLVGGGDPLLMTADYAQTLRYPPQLRTPIEELADDLVRSGVSTINGGVHAVETRYDTDRYPDGWPERFATQGQSGPLSALMINDGFTSWPANANDWRFGDPPVAADDPALSAASLFDDLLEAQQVIISGGARNVTRNDLAGIEENLIELASIESPPMSEIVRQMLVQSDNTTAELLLKAIGLEANNAGTTQVGARAVQSILADSGLPRLAVPPADGSGLDAGNKVSCRYVADLLERAIPGVTPFGDALPIAGQDGTLAERFVGTIAEGRVRAKTGTLNDVTALAGVVETEKGDLLQFAYMLNLVNGQTVSDAIVDLQEDLGVALVNYPAGPSIDEVAPAGANAIAAEALGVDTESIAESIEIEPLEPSQPATSTGSEPGDEKIEELRELFEELQNEENEG